MVDDEKRENLANARRKLKKFRDQQQPNVIETNGNNVHPSNEPVVHHNIIPHNVPNFINDQQILLNGMYQNMTQSPDTEFDKSIEQHHQYGVSIENPKQERIRLENPRLSSGGSNMSRHSSQTSIDSEQKLRRDNEHLQEQLEMHMQTIGILVADKTDISAKLTQSFKQLERKQGEMDELYGRLKASRERVQELEKEIQNSTSNVQKREMAAKESDKENDRLKIENIRQSQLIEDLKQNINELRDRQTNIEQLNEELQQLKIQSQSTTETSITEQQINDIQQTLTLKNNQIEELHSSINRMRSDNDQYQKYNNDMQYHIQDLNNQINQLTEANKTLQNEQNEFKLIDRSSVLEYDNLQQENHLFRNAIDQWSNRYEDLRIKLEQMTKLNTEKDEQITELKQTSNKSNDINKEDSNNRIEQIQSKSFHEQEIQTETNLSLSSDLINDQEPQQQFIENYHRIMSENVELKDRIQHLDHVILQLQSETETIGDYIYLYQQQRQQLQKRHQETDDYVAQLTQDRLNLQKKISELEMLIVHSLNIPMNQSESNEQLETTDNSLSTTDQSTVSNIVKTSSLPQLSDDTRARIMTLIKELEQNNISVRQNNTSSSVKLAFVDKNFYICSTCSGPVQWV